MYVSGISLRGQVKGAFVCAVLRELCQACQRREAGLSLRWPFVRRDPGQRDDVNGLVTGTFHSAVKGVGYTVDS
jgi:hypothetical protein